MKILNICSPSGIPTHDLQSKPYVWIPRKITDIATRHMLSAPVETTVALIVGPHISIMWIIYMQICNKGNAVRDNVTTKSIKHRIVPFYIYRIHFIWSIEIVLSLSLWRPHRLSISPIGVLFYFVLQLNQYCARYVSLQLLQRYSSEHFCFRILHTVIFLWWQWYIAMYTIQQIKR